MPAHNFSRITNALAQLVENEITEQVNRSVPALSLLSCSFGRGKNMAWDVEFPNSGEATDSSIADGADVSTYEDNDIVQATLPWGIYSQAISITGLAESVAQSTGDPTELQDLFGQKIEAAVRRLTNNLGRDFWQGPGTGTRMLGMYGGATLQAGSPLSAAGTYANISRATYASWGGNVLANGGTPRALTVELMRDARRAIYDASGEMPDIIFCDSFQHEQYGLTFGDQRRYLDEIRTADGRTIRLDAGYKALEFDGIPVVMDVKHPAGCMTFMNRNSVKIRQSRSAPSRLNRSPGELALAGGAEEQFGKRSTGLVARVNELARTGDAYKWQLVLYPQVQTRRCNTQAVLADLATS